MNSSRLNGKALKKICDRPVLEWVVDSIKKTKLIDDFIFATTIDSSDDVLVDYLKEKGYKYYRGSVDNVAERLFEASKLLKPDHIVRIVGDHPLNSSEIANFLIEKHLETNSDFTSVKRDNIAIGILSEIISYNAFVKLFNSNLDFSLSEYLTYYFTNNPQYFNINIFDAPAKLRSKNYRLVLDYEEDLIVIENIIKKIFEVGKEINHVNILEVLDGNTDMTELNNKYQQKYLQSDLFTQIKNKSTIINN